MSDGLLAQRALDAAMKEAARLRQSIGAGPGPQLRSAEDRDLARTVALTWFNTHRPVLLSLIDVGALTSVDNCYTAVLSAADRASARSTYDSALKEVARKLSEVRTKHLVPASARAGQPSALAPPPSFAKLVSDPLVQGALERRWEECNACITAKAPLAAIVMMGGLLEALLLARINAEPTSAPIFTAKAAPRDRAGKTVPLKDWALRSYIDVAHELGWISQSAKDLGVVLRDYRNYIHPYKEISHGIALTVADAALLWDVARSISKQLVK
ncbi:MAG: hypothetical protein HOP28_03310 [Gemmatimonadales bacterium]|nr:hypothetical protein [Gemmatimonadales bacterium]